MKIASTTCPIIIHEVRNHSEIKPKILEAIKSMGVHSNIDAYQRISNSDWQLHRDYPRPYFEVIQPLLQQVYDGIKEVFFITEDVQTQNYWFQEYHKGDFHAWHVHPAAMFSNVYYVSLPEGSSYTHFKVNGEEFSVPVTEGCVLTFPSFYSHESKEHKGEEPKTSVVFNI